MQLGVSETYAKYISCCHYQPFSFQLPFLQEFENETRCMIGCYGKQVFLLAGFIYKPPHECMLQNGFSCIIFLEVSKYCLLSQVDFLTSTQSFLNSISSA